MLRSRTKHSSVALAILFAVPLLAIAAYRGYADRGDTLLRECVRSASKAYVELNYPRPVFYELDEDGAKLLAKGILEETSPHTFRTQSLAILVKAVFIGPDGSPMLHCSLPAPSASMTLESAIDHWERTVRSIGSSEVIDKPVEPKPRQENASFIRRRIRD